MNSHLCDCLLQGDQVVPSQPPTDRHRSVPLCVRMPRNAPLLRRSPEPDSSVAAKEVSQETTLESALESLGLSEYADNFHQEKVDFESLVILHIVL